MDKYNFSHMEKSVLYSIAASYKNSLAEIAWMYNEMRSFDFLIIALDMMSKSMASSQQVIDVLRSNGTSISLVEK
jgi:hypothetical protein